MLTRTADRLLLLLLLLLALLCLLVAPKAARAAPPDAPQASAATRTGGSLTVAVKPSQDLPRDPLLLHAYRAVILETWGPLEPWKLNAYRKVLNGMMRVQGRCTRTSYCSKCDPSAHGDAWKYQPNVTCAAGPEVPINSIIWLEGEGLRIVTDRGGAVGRHHFDLFAGASCPEGCNDGTYHGVRYAIIERGQPSHRKGKRHAHKHHQAR